MQQKIKINCVIGIDPGASGGIAVWRPNTPTKTLKMPEDLMRLKSYFDELKLICNPIVFLEKLTLRPDDMAVAGKVFRIQKMLSSFEELKAVIKYSDIPFVLVNPQKWQTDLKLKVKGEEKADRKRRYRDAAAKYYPEVSAALWNADALMLLHFGRYKLQTSPDWVLENLPKPMHDKLF